MLVINNINPIALRLVVEAAKVGLVELKNDAKFVNDEKSVDFDELCNKINHIESVDTAIFMMERILKNNAVSPQATK